MPVAAGVVGDGRVRAGVVLAARDMAAERRRAAALDCAHHLQLVETDVSAVGFTPSGTVVAEDALSQMDVPTRTSYVMAVVTPQERPAAASITTVPKTFAWAAGSMISGYLLTLSAFGWPLLIGGVIKGVYDILLLIKFQKVRPPEEAGAAAD